MDFDIFDEISSLDTEIVDTEFADIDLMSVEDILMLINKQDQLVPLAIKDEINNIADVVRKCVAAFQQQGRLIYIGAGTSGRIGILDAAECPPTFGTSPNDVQGFIAGGNNAVFKAVEGAEDNENDGAFVIKNINVTNKDVVCGLAASGRTPWVLAGLKQAKNDNAYTTLITTNSNRKNYSFIDKIICPKVGAEIIAGSTRMKSGTAQKLILNMITTASMIQIGKTYKNIMIDLQPMNQKLIERAKRIIMIITGVDKPTAENILTETNYNVKLALVRLIYNFTNEEAIEHIKFNKGKIRKK
jgi:N-acetylmuramic acid 6-phosphate etherase